MHRSKLYREQASKFERYKQYSLREAFEILKSMPHVKFNESVEAVFRLGIDPKLSDQTVRGAVTLPKGTGKQIRIVVIASGQAAEDAKAAGADHVGLDDLINKIKDGWFEFDSLITTTADMPKVRPLGKVLGPKGLMPNPKTGTLTDNVAEAVRQAKAGRIEFRADRGGCAHVLLGKISFSVDDLDANCHAVIHALLASRPAGIKGAYIIGCSVSSTMSPGIRINIKDFTGTGA